MEEMKRESNSRKARPKFLQPLPWKLECPECGKMLVTSYNLRQHMRVVHSGGGKKPSKSETINKNSDKLSKTLVKDSLRGDIVASQTMIETLSANQTPESRMPSPPSSTDSFISVSSTNFSHNTSLKNYDSDGYHQWDGSSTQSTADSSASSSPASNSTNSADVSNPISSQSADTQLSTKPKAPNSKREGSDWASRLRKPATRWRPAWDRNGKLKLDPALVEYYLYEDLESVSNKTEDEKKQRKIEDYWIYVMHKKSRKC